jgi:hypothetical protein
MKNIVICCDGTRAKYDDSDENSNMVRLFERLGKDGDRQISYYDPGVGTHSPLKSAFLRPVDKLVMSVHGTGIRTNVEEAYRYLMGQFEPGDRVFLFGYSRGAYTIRALAGMIHKCGLLTKGSNNLVPYATRIYKEAGDEIAAGKLRLTPSPPQGTGLENGEENMGRRVTGTPGRAERQRGKEQILPFRLPFRRSRRSGGIYRVHEPRCSPMHGNGRAQIRNS